MTASPVASAGASQTPPAFTHADGVGADGVGADEPAALGARLPIPRQGDERFHWGSSAPFFLLHLTPFLVVFTGWSWRAVVLGFLTFSARMFFITAGYHRYFAHRSYRLARVPQFIMAFGGATAAQKGPLWWAAHHRDHHRWSDTDRDIHSPQRGFWWSHMNWIVCDRYSDTKFDRIKDFAKFPELRFIDKFDWIGPWSLGVACYLIAGWQGLVIGFFTSTVLCWHATFTINSLAHVFGRRRYVTEDTSRNSALLAVLTMGEGWHNNHHYYPASARQGFFWWEWDPSFYVLKILSWVGVVKDMKTPPAWALQASRVRDGNFDIGMFRAHWNKATRAVVAASEQLSERVSERRASAGETLHDKRLALESFVRGSMESAEELATLARRTQRAERNPEPPAAASPSSP